MMTRDEAIMVLRKRAALAFNLPIQRVHVSWDQKHSKPKVTLDPTIETLRMGEAEVGAILAELLEDPQLVDELKLLREPMSDDELRSRLKATRDRQEN